MPAISNVSLTVTGSTWTDFTLDVSYTVSFSPLERFLAANGLSFEERIQIVGDDAGDATDVVLHTFQAQAIPAAPGAINRKRSITVSSGTLNEDPGRIPTNGGGLGGWTTTKPDADEILARVEVGYIGLSTGPLRVDSPVHTLQATF